MSKHISFVPACFSTWSFRFFWMVLLCVTGVNVVVANPLQPVETGSPRETYLSFRENLDHLYEEVLNQEDQGKVEIEKRRRFIRRAARCLDMSHIPETLREQKERETVALLYEVLNRIAVFGGDIPTEIDIDGNTVEKWTVPDTEITIVRMKEGPRAGEYLFSADTVARVREFYESVRDEPYNVSGTHNLYEYLRSQPAIGWMRWIVNSMPSWTRQCLGNNAVWQWVGTILTLSIGLSLMATLFRIGRKIRGWASKSRFPKLNLSFAFPLLAMFVPLWMRDFGADGLLLTGGAQVIWILGQNVLFNLALMGVVMAAGARIVDWLTRGAEKNPVRKVDPLIVRLVGRITTIALAVIIFIESGSNMGIPMSTILAGAGVGGLTLALGAQDAVKNLLGGMMLLLDKPAVVGDRVLVAGYDGVVEDIGLRSTKLRLLTGHLTTIPNEKFSQSDLENVARRPHIRRVMEFPLALTIEPAKIDRAVAIILETLDNHEGMDEEFPPRAFMDGFQRDAITLKVLAWYHPPAYWDYVAWGQRITVEILQKFAAEDIQLAAPARKVSVDPPELPLSHAQS